jgi:hypothetical protein
VLAHPNGGHAWGEGVTVKPPPNALEEAIELKLIHESLVEEPRAAWQREKVRAPEARPSEGEREGRRRRRDLYRPSPRLGRYFLDRKTPGLRVSNSRRRNDSQPSVPHRPGAFTHYCRLGQNGNDLDQ